LGILAVYGGEQSNPALLCGIRSRHVKGQFAAEAAKDLICPQPESPNNTGKRHYAQAPD